MDPAPNQMMDGYEASDSMLETEYYYAEKDVCPTCGAEDCNGKCEEPFENGME